MRVMFFALFLGSVITLGAAPAEAWRELYKPVERVAPVTRTAPEIKRATGAPEGICIAEILRAQKRHGIPDNLLLGLGLQEAGTTRNGVLTVWPYAVNSEGRGRLFDSVRDALRFVEAEQRTGVRSIDVGCMQINLRWHPKAFTNAAAGFDPARNVDYAARFLRRLYDESGDWKIAIGNYHSKTPEKRAIYTRRALQNIAVANERIETFRSLAAGARLPASETVAMADTRPKSEGAPRGAQLWSTGGGDTNTRFTPYGQYKVQPILPVLIRGN